MTSKCIVRKFSGVYSNPNILKIDEIWLNDYQVSSASLNEPVIVNLEGSTVITPVSGNFYYKEGSSGTLSNADIKTEPVTLPTRTYALVYVPNGSKVKMNNSYGLRVINGLNVDVYHFNGCVNLLRMYNITGDISKANPTICSQLMSCAVASDVSKASDILEKLTTATAVSLQSSANIADTMTAIGAKMSSSVTTINLPYNGTLIEGSIEDFINAFKLKKANGSITFRPLGETNITFEGTVVNGTKSFTVSWTGNTVSLTYL